MANKQARKLQKRKERERNIAVKQREEAARRDYQRRFPTFRFEHESDADPQFVAAVHEALQSVNLRDPKFFHPSETSIYETAKHRGNAIISRMLEDERTAVVASRFLNKIGSIVFSLIGEERLKQWIPFNDVRILPLGPYILVSFHGLCSQPGPFGTVYYSHHRPKITIDGAPYTVAWSKHAIEQTCDRIKPGWRTYAGLGDAFAFFDDCCYFEPAELYTETGTRNRGFTFYDQCVTRFFSERYVTEILGVPLKQDRHFYRVGYCPAAVEGEFFKATTLLCPGYRSTPEFTALYSANLPFAEKRRLMEQAKQYSGQQLYETKDFTLLKWYHENGVAQVIETERKMYHTQVATVRRRRTKSPWRP